MKGAHADPSSTAWQEIGVKPYFGLSGITRHSTRRSSHRQRSSCDDRRRQGGKKIHRIIIEPAAPFGGGPQQGIDEETGDCAQSRTHRVAGAKPQGKDGDQHHYDCRAGSGQGAGKADRAVTTRRDAAERGHHERLAPQDLSQFAG